MLLGRPTFNFWLKAWSQVSLQWPNQLIKTKCKTFYYKTPKIGLNVQDTVTFILVNLR